MPVAVLLVGATTWVVTGRALRPVEAIRAQVAAIGGDDLAARVPVPPSRDEVARLATTMNGMLERLERSADQQRRFVSDTSHELRSPLAGLRQTAEVARSHPDAIDRAELTEAVLEETARMQHLVEQMLVLTRTAEGGGGRRRTDVDLDDLVLAEATRLRRLRPDLAVDASRVVPARAHGDGPALAQVVRNLADNAARHAAGAVRLSLEVGPSQHVDVVVEDDGAGVAADDRERVFERFVRLDEARARDDGGSGLGLAIVREVARAHGGDARVETGELGGARFVVRLPVVADVP
nr:HAMP domain-containing sensor histidine kinase [Nocardioides zeae]